MVSVIFFAAFTILWAAENIVFPTAGRRNDVSFFVLLSAMLISVISSIAGGYFQWLSWSVSTTSTVIGLGLFATGIILRYWGILKMGKSFSRRLHSPAKLVTNGPFRYLRHPLYSGLCTTVIGLSVYIGTWIGVLAAVFVLFPTVAWRAAKEERELHKLFGEDYRVFCKKRWRIIPLIY
ncbi:methyltransferase family protein [Aureibacillus halotolerans]|uniref:Protein-S-isoprenylcysteine O-methyltransferase Ste14 n=1 Tax=Aureibacillus halotolerans TaxID=1508390 RepID=A0A4R6U265_9BACI|nr:isoprenylcysteine carboxylmethyltransferase family protein [Aureibacillus halotolerans]TDQ38793.1 protein-S-isoprenylcysteine O-methyltransferase Ste14 [Aureibacillus halotolerans]